MSGRGRQLGREPRRLILVDIENIAGGSLRAPAAAEWARSVVETALTVAPGEQVIVGVSSIDGLFHAKNSWPQARVVLGLGPDGADHALLDVLDHEDVGARFCSVAIASGDGIFTDAAVELARQGVRVTAVGWGKCMAARLQLAAGQTVLLDEPSARDVGATA